MVGLDRTQHQLAGQSVEFHAAHSIPKPYMHAAYWTKPTEQNYERQLVIQPAKPIDEQADRRNHYRELQPQTMHTIVSVQISITSGP
jgi:hypothetical protein